MAKQSYKIPADLNQSYGNMEIAIQSKNGIGAKPLPIAVILTYVGSLVLLFYVCTHTLIKYGTVIQIGLFIVLWLAMTLVLARYDKTKRMQAQLIPTLLGYIPSAARNVITRTSSLANDFYSIAKIDSIDDNCVVNYSDGTYGLWYMVVGSASKLLFDDDRDAILNRVDSFYRKIGTEVESIFITLKESQKVTQQLSNLEKRCDNLVVQDSDLLLIANEQRVILKDYVGGSFKSIHQYLIIKADNKEALIHSKNVIQSEVENSSLMLKQCIPLLREDINKINRVIYRGED